MKKVFVVQTKDSADYEIGNIRRIEGIFETKENAINKIYEFLFKKIVDTDPLNMRKFNQAVLTLPMMPRSTANDYIEDWCGVVDENSAGLYYFYDDKEEWTSSIAYFECEVHE